MRKLLSKSQLLKKLCILIIIILGCWQFGTGSYVYAKAQFAQLLLTHAWSKTLHGEREVRPWAWADTFPVAKLNFQTQNRDLIVLAGASGRTMAFGPGHLSATPLPGNGGNSVIVGHRDTHFSLLEDIKLGDVIRIQLPNKYLNYKVAHTFIVDKDQSEVMQDYGVERLTLITCYPFDALYPGGPLRYIVQANLI